MIKETRIRLTAFGIAIAFVAGTLALAFPRGDDGTITVKALFPKTIGLFSQSHVRVLGVSVGRVSSVRPTGNQVEVVMRIDGKRKIPADATAVLVPISLIADRYIQLTPVYSSGPVLADGAVIPTDRTAIPAELDDVLSQLKKFLDAVEAGTKENPESIGAAVQNLANAFEGAGDDFSRALSGGGALGGSIVANAAEVDAIVVHLARLSGALAVRRNDIAQLNTRLAGALGSIASERDALGRALSSVAVLTEQLGSLVKQHRKTLEADVTILAKTTTAVLRHQDSLIRSLEWVHVLADGAENGHNLGAIHERPLSPTHIDVRDEHLFPCALAVPTATCLLLGLTGTSLPVSATAPAGSASGAVGNAPATATAGDAAPDPLDLLDLLPRVQLPGGASALRLLPAPTPSATPGGVRGFFDRVGGMLDGALRWLM